MTLRRLFSGVLPVLSVAVADYLGARRSARSMTPLDPAWHKVAALYDASAHSSAVLALNPAAYWRFGESAGTTATDASGNARHGTYGQGPTLGVAGLLTGDADTAVRFDGVDDDMSFPAVGVTGAFSYAVLFERTGAPTGGGSHHTLGSRLNGGADGLYPRLLIDEASGDALVQWRDAGSVDRNLSVAGLNATTGRHHFVVTHDGTTCRLYMDGTERGSAAGSIIAGGAGAGIIGRAAGFALGTLQANGVIDEPAIWTRALTAAEIADLNAAGA